MSLVAKGVGLTFLAIIVGLVLTHPAADQTVINSGSSAYVSGVEALQLR